MQLVMLLRSCLRLTWWPRNNFTNFYTTSVMFVGALRTGTGLHVDRTQAVNLALAISGQYGVLAIWLFVSPVVTAELDKLLRTDAFKKRFPNGLKNSGVLLSEDDMRFIVEKFPGQAFIVEQCAGVCVLVPPGWIHAVFNKQSCLKLAFDSYVVSNFIKYHLSSVNAAAYFNNQPDYMCWVNAACSEFL